MDILQLQAVVTLAEELQFVRAARRLGITQPALSQRIQRTEADLGASLFVRVQRGVALSEAGKVFVPEAKAVIETFNRAVETARQVSQGRIGRLRIGFVENASFHLLPLAASRFRTRHPNATMELAEMISADLTDRLLDGQIDVALMRPVTDDHALSTRLVLSEPYAVALPESHALASQSSVTIAALAALPMIIAAGKKANYLKARLRPHFLRHGYDLKIGQEVDQLAAIIAFVAAGMGYTITPHSATGMQVPGVVYRPLASPDAPKAEMIVAWRKNDANPLLESFLRLVPAQT